MLNMTKAEIDAARNKQLGEEAAMAAALLGLPPLTGSEKQRSWGETLRARIISQSRNNKSILKFAKSRKLSHRADFWIFNRFKTAAEFVAFVAEEAKLKAELKADFSRIKKIYLKKLQGRFGIWGR